MTLVVPPIKLQGIKTKLVPAIQASVSNYSENVWIEPFCGSCVVALNTLPEKALLADTNKHIINFYKAVQSGEISAVNVKEFLGEEGNKLTTQGEKYYYEVRDRFNKSSSSLDFLFLNRACFNGIMRFNREGKFNVPFCRKPERFSPAYITKISNQVKNFANIVQARDWKFEVLDYSETLARASAADFVYTDPPYAGRHVDYYNSWDENEELKLVELLKQVPCKFLLSTWYSNIYRTNLTVENYWKQTGYFITLQEHFYHVGSTESLRHAMTEALVSNFEPLLDCPQAAQLVPTQLELFVV